MDIKRICVHHNDLDGISAGAIVKARFPESYMIEYDYGQPLELPQKNVPVIMVDVSLPMHQMRDVGVVADGFTWIDHHKSAIDDFNNNYVTGRETEPLINPILRVGKAGCELTWEYYFSDKPMPQAIWLLGRYDVWDMSDKDEWHNRILPFQYGMRAICNSVETFPMGLLNNEPDTTSRVEEIIEYGKQILSYQAMQNQKRVKSFAFPALWKRFRVIAMNGAGNSKMFDAVWDEEKYDLMLTFQFTGKFWKCSIYTTHKDIDCSSIAKSMGGGGHRGASGFQVNHFEELGLKYRS